ncbi:hypothetical protein [Paenibacillus soyae]|uniref:Uncharacterized protein n=1 Tax=Paenibacillus soyae TaxID=2969249 RepID=A0A9X2SD09_9BACL|nr:hypothetical protein [Paenibacillus soyae]MCR2807353.1 hypothetical protein [Paenibacillus soyae]
MAFTRRDGRAGLSPPAATYYNEIRSAIGRDNMVQVGPLVETPGGDFVVTLTVRGEIKAQALATLLVRRRMFGDARLTVRVRTAGGQLVTPITRTLTPQQIAELYRKAFATNERFSFVRVRRIFGTTFVYPVFRAQVVQFFNDDLSDYYGNYNSVAAFTFRSVLRRRISGTTIQFSTVRRQRA